MKLSEFIRTYNRSGVIILLEGKRNVKLQDQPKLTALGTMLAKKLPLASFRSGNADGADLFFSRGVAQVNANRLQVIVPYENHRAKKNYAGDTIALDVIDLSCEPEVVRESKSHKNTHKLVDKFVAGQKNRFVIKAAYIIRDTIKVLGTNSGVPPVDFAFFYDDPENPRTGGTGHTMNICERNNVPMLTQEVWLQWLESGN